MSDYQKYINALKKCAKEHKDDRTPFAHVIVSDLCSDVAILLEKLEQEPTFDEIGKQALIDLLKDEPIQTLEIAYLYAKNHSKYGEDVTRTWLTATENSSALEKAYEKGYYDALKRGNMHGYNKL